MVDLSKSTHDIHVIVFLADQQKCQLRIFPNHISQPDSIKSLTSLYLTPIKMGGELKFKQESDALELRFGNGKVSVNGQYFLQFILYCNSNNCGIMTTTLWRR